MSMSWRLLTVALGLTSLTSCESARAPQYGTGPLTLSPLIQASFDKYLTEFTPAFFFVSLDGLHSYYVYCRETNCTDSISIYGIRNCESHSGGVPCKIYAVGRKIVWQFDATTENTDAPSAQTDASKSGNKAQSAPNQAAKPAPTSERVSSRIEWISEGVSQRINGIVGFDRGTNVGAVTISWPEGGECDGTFAISGNTGTRAVSCP